MMLSMRTTVTLDPDSEQLIRRRMRERGITFKQAVNDAIRASEMGHDRPFRTETAPMGESGVNLDRALQIVADLEDDELIRKMRSGS
jgi:type II secretory pathway component PulF